jgi:hypothetical protein
MLDLLGWLAYIPDRPYRRRCVNAPLADYAREWRGAIIVSA